MTARRSYGFGFFAARITPQFDVIPFRHLLISVRPNGVGADFMRNFVFDAGRRKGEKKPDHDTETLGSLVVHRRAGNQRTSSFFGQPAEGCGEGRGA